MANRWHIPNLNRSALVLAMLELIGNAGIIAARKYIPDAEWSAWGAHGVLTIMIALGVVSQSRPKGTPDEPRPE